MRTIVGAIAVLGLAAVAGAQPPRERGATFRPPEPLQPGELPLVARGASEELPPSFPSSTPVSRPDSRAPSGRGPAWLSGTDPGVQPAGGTLSRGGRAPASAPPETKEEPFLSSKGLDRLRGAIRPQPVNQAQPQEPPTAATPFRGTSSSGAPVYAGPPAYRWFGYGTPTPGANQFAPTGQYPKASANWYSITGATPGAFPVAVMNPMRTPPGTEPPSYASAPPPADPQSVVSASGPPAQPPQLRHTQPQWQSQPRSQPVDRPEPPKFDPVSESKFVPAPGVGSAPAPLNVPKLTPPPAATAAAPPAALPTGTVPPAAPPAPPAVNARAAAPAAPPAAPKVETVAALPPVVPPSVLPPPALPPLPAPAFPAVEPAKPVSADAPNQLPISVTTEPKPEEPQRPEAKPPVPRREEHNWQAAPEPAQPAPGTWAPVGGRTAPAPPAPELPAWRSGSANVKPVVARAQAPDTTPDPIGALIRQLCAGRAADVDVRWSGTKKVMVCFEVRTAPEAQKLVTEISRRPELAQYQIDFCVVVK